MAFSAHAACLSGTGVICRGHNLLDKSSPFRVQIHGVIEAICNQDLPRGIQTQSRRLTGQTFPAGSRLKLVEQLPSVGVVLDEVILNVTYQNLVFVVHRYGAGRRRSRRKPLPQFALSSIDLHHTCSGGYYDAVALVTSNVDWEIDSRKREFETAFRVEDLDPFVSIVGHGEISICHHSDVCGFVELALVLALGAQLFLVHSTLIEELQAVVAGIRYNDVTIVISSQTSGVEKITRSGPTASNSAQQLFGPAGYERNLMR